MDDEANGSVFTTIGVMLLPMTLADPALAQKQGGIPAGVSIATARQHVDHRGGQHLRRSCR